MSRDRNGAGRAGLASGSFVRSRGTRRAAYVAVPVVIAAVSLSRGWAPGPSTAAPQIEPLELVLHGFARDFQPSHPDFNLDQSGDERVVADRVSKRLGAGNVPTEAGDGKPISLAWVDRNGNVIAPHLGQAGPTGSAIVSEGGLRLVRDPLIQSRGEVLTWNWADGPFDRARAGRNPTILTNQPMPTVDVPSVPRGQTVIVERGNGAVLDSSIHVPDYMVRADQIVTVRGDVTLIVDNTFIVETGAKIELEPGASLSIYGLGTMFFQTGSTLNANTQDVSAVKVFSVGGRDLFFENRTLAYCSVVVPRGRLVIQDQSLVFANVTAEMLHLQDASTLVISGGGGYVPPPTAGCGATADLFGAFAATPAAPVRNLDQWFIDVPGVNAGMPVAMSLARRPDGVYSIVEDTYAPINGELYGNDAGGASGAPAFNSNFTWTCSATAEYVECGGQYIAAGGNGDWYVYINDALVIEYSSGGELSGQRIDLDRVAASLGLANGKEFKVDLFYAQRGEKRRAMALETNIEMRTAREYLPPSRSEFD